MTLDEARACLGVERGASTMEIHRAFRARARALHPDRHPEAHPADHARLSVEFDRARVARDALLSWAALAPDSSASAPTPPPPPAPASPPKTEPSPEQPSRPRARPRTSEKRREASAPRVTMRFDEFVAFTDAAGFGIGARTRRTTDWARIIVWSTLGLIIAAFAGACLYVAVA